MAEEPPPPEFWAGVFDRLADSYDQSGVPFFGPIAAGLVERLAPQPGERVLELGAGRGAATLPLAEAVGPAGSVTAVDASDRMVTLLSVTATERGLRHVTVVRGDAAAPPTGTYDVVAASLLLFFLPDPVTALAHWRSLLAPGGRIGVSTFAPWPDSMREVVDVLDAYRPPDAVDTTRMAPPFRTDDGVERLFRGAGFATVTTARTTYPVPFSDVRQWRAWSTGTALNGLWQHVPEEKVPEAMERLDRALRDRGHRLDVDVRYTLARP